MANYQGRKEMVQQQSIFGPKHAVDSSLNDLLGEQTVTVQREGGISSAEIIWHGYNVAVFTKHYYD